MQTIVTTHATEEHEEESFPILAGALDDLSVILSAIRENVIRKAARIARIPVDAALDTLLHKKTTPVLPTTSLRVPAITLPSRPLYVPPSVSTSAPMNTSTTGTKSRKIPYFENGMDIPRLNTMREWDPLVHCHRRTRMGFCSRKACGGDSESIESPRLCKQCQGIYKKHSAGISSGWRGTITEPFLPDTNPKEYATVSKRAEGNTYMTHDGQKVMCCWYYARYYWSYYHTIHGMLFYDNRSGMAIKKLPVDWDRGTPKSQQDPILGCSEEDIIDLREHLTSQGWSPVE